MTGRAIIITTILVLFLLWTGCSSQSDAPVLPVEPEHQNMVSGHNLLGMWKLTFDPLTERITGIPSRDVDAHYNVTGMLLPPSCDDCIIFTVNSYDPDTQILDLGITFHNKTVFTPHDVRGIIFTQDNTTPLMNADSWTHLYDPPGGYDINPFKAYVKEDHYRPFPPNDVHTENYILRIPSPPNLGEIKFAIDASWPENCEEPFAITDFEQQHTLYDYQGAEADLFYKLWCSGSVYPLPKTYLHCPEVTGIDWIEIDYRNYNWHRVKLVNETGALPGEYEAIIKGTIVDDGEWNLYNVVSFTIDPTPPAVGWTHVWVGEQGGDDYGRGVAVDQAGNVYATGDVLQEEDWHWPYLMSYIVDSYVHKYNHLGVLQWSNYDFEPSMVSRGYGIAVDQTGNVYACGTAQTDHDADVECYLSKLDSNGLSLWNIYFGGEGMEQPRQVEVDSAGNTYVCGNFSGSADFDPTDSTDIHVSNGWSDAFLASYDPQGELRWARTWGGVEHDFAFDIALDTFGNHYLIGQFMETVDFNPDPDVVEERTSNGGVDSYLAKYDSDGNFLWVKTWGGPYNDTLRAIDINPAYGQIHLCGMLIGEVDLDPGPGVDLQGSSAGGQPYLSRFELNGNYSWARVWEVDPYGYARTITQDSSGNLIIAGTFEDWMDLDPGSGVSEESNEDYNMFMCKLDQNGDFVQKIMCEGTGAMYAYEIASDQQDNMILCGDFHNEFDFDPGPGVDMHRYQGGHDVFLQKLLPNGRY